MAYTKSDILGHLREFRKKNEEFIKEAEDDISAEMFAKSTVTGGAFANAARAACDNRAARKRNEVSQLNEVNAWMNEMLRKY